MAFDPTDERNVTQGYRHGKMLPRAQSPHSHNFLWMVHQRPLTTIGTEGVQQSMLHSKFIVKIINMVNQAFNPGLSYSSYFVRKRLMAAIAKEAPHLHGRLLDFGCGSKPYQSMFAVDEYIGLDYENEGHPHANEQIDVFYDGQTIPFGDAHFDAVFCSEVFEHVFNLEAVIKEIHRVLKPDAKMLVTCPFMICEHEKPNDFARYSSFGIADLLRRNGFEIIRHHKTGNAVEAITQQKLTYIHTTITPKIANVPIARELFRRLVYGFYNLKGLILGRLLPNNADFFLNNVILCKKSNT
jgi:ubiquinone/menaquinone biosynthesis C-methylase UbiE